MATRINSLETATNIKADDYLVIDGQTEGTRKVLASDVGSDKMIDFATSQSQLIDSRGVSAKPYYVYPSGQMPASELARKMSAYLGDDVKSYPLIITQVQRQSTFFLIYVKAIEGNVQSESSSTISGTLHIVAPFEISSVVPAM